MNRTHTTVAVAAGVTILAAGILAWKSYVSTKAQEKQIKEMRKALIKLSARPPMSPLPRTPVHASESVYPEVGTPKIRRRILVTGGAGFVGSNLVDVLMLQGHQVYVLDNLFTGRRKNIEHWIGHPNFSFFQDDVIKPFMQEVDQIYHLACPASPPHYQHNPIKTIKCSTMGTMNMLGLAKRTGARMLFTSTSEVYGDPEVHPQTEDYRGCVNIRGPRACYDEGKRLAETMCYCYVQKGFVSARIARIFNTYGPRMHPHDGRVVSNFIIQALQGEALTVYGDGMQTRSFQYVTDLVRGLILLMNSSAEEPVNIGNPDELTIKAFAEYITAKVNPDSKVSYLEMPKDDPKKRRPDISRAKVELDWEPVVSMEEGMNKTIDYFRDEIGASDLGSTKCSIWVTREFAESLP